MSVGTADAPATATVSYSTFLDNQAIGGAAGAGAPFTRAGLGGAIMNDAGTFTVSHSQFQRQPGRRRLRAAASPAASVPAAPSRTSPSSATRSSPSARAR